MREKPTLKRTETRESLNDSNSLESRSRQELIQLARDLSKGSYKKNSEQRRQILQMIADNLFAAPKNPP